jgi:hypothetical protein
MSLPASRSQAKPNRLDIFHPSDVVKRCTYFAIPYFAEGHGAMLIPLIT